MEMLYKLSLQRIRRIEKRTRIPGPWPQQSSWSIFCKNDLQPFLKFQSVKQQFPLEKVLKTLVEMLYESKQENIGQKGPTDAVLRHLLRKLCYHRDRETRAERWRRGIIIIRPGQQPSSHYQSLPHLPISFYDNIFYVLLSCRCLPPFPVFDLST